MNEQSDCTALFLGQSNAASNWASFSSSEPRLAHVFPSAAPAMCSHDLQKTTRLSYCAPLLPTLPAVSRGSSPFRLPCLAFRTRLIFFSWLTCFPCSSVGTHHIIIIFGDNPPLQLHYEFLKKTFLSDWESLSTPFYATVHLLLQRLCIVWFSRDPVLLCPDITYYSSGNNR